jgi:hypothetical protein
MNSPHSSRISCCTMSSLVVASSHGVAVHRYCGCHYFPDAGFHCLTTLRAGSSLVCTVVVLVVPIATEVLYL